MIYRIAHIALAVPLEEPLDYLVPEHLQQKISIGQRVWVPFINRKVMGYVVDLSESSPREKLKSIYSIIDRYPVVTSGMLKIARKIEDHYGCSLGEAIDVMLPKLLRKGRGVSDRPQDNSFRQPNPKRMLVIDQTQDARWSFLLKTVRNITAKQRKVLFLVPEARMIRPVVEKLNELSLSILAQGKQTELKELDAWQKMVSGQVDVVVGMRSEIFTPIKDLGMIVVFNEENDAFKQEQMPCYEAGKIALWRSAIDQCHLIYISSAPSCELYETAKTNSFDIKILDQEQKCSLKLIDMNNYDPKKSSIISIPLQNRIQELLINKKQMVLVVSRLGLIEIVQKRIAFLFPQAKAVDYNSLTKRMPKRFDILIATPSIVREVMEELFDEVALLDADSELCRIDYESAHQEFMMLTYLKQMTKDFLWIQTRQPDHYVIKAVLSNKYEEFYQQDLDLRKELELPPFRFMLKLTVRSKNGEKAKEVGLDLENALLDQADENVDVFGSDKDNMVFLNNKYRYTISVLGKEYNSLHSFVSKVLKSVKKRKGVVIAKDLKF